MEFAGDIPLSSQHWISYFWNLDTDRNPSTGMKFYDLGVDLKVRAAFDPAKGIWEGLIERSQGSAGTGGLPLKVSGNRVEVSVPANELGNPISFDWTASTYYQADNTGDICPSQGYMNFPSGGPIPEFQNFMIVLVILFLTATVLRKRMNWSKQVAERRA